MRVLERKNDEKIEFVKSYSRDTTLFMQGLWARGLDQQARAKFGWENPHVPFVAHVVNDGVVEIWEHKKAIKWFLDMLLVKNKKGDEFLAALLAEYKTILLKLKKLHEKKILVSESDTAAYTQLVYDAAFAMTVFFYTGMDERSPESAKDIAVHAREQGDFFADNDVFVRKNIASAAHISEQLAGVVLPDEFGEVPSEPILTERQTSFILIDGSEAFVGSTKRYEEEHPEYHFLKPELDANMSEVSGQVAYKGKVQGVVRIVKKQSDMSRVRAGDILVSPMTTPDFLPAMQKAIAFVTDEGGVTCHAAIVSRELKKPCIIGTKIATQVLQDGDLIEVDADNGVVRIIEKA